MHSRHKNITPGNIITAAATLCLLVLFGVSEAAEMPVYGRLLPISAALSAPNAVALDSGGGVFAAESSSNKVNLYTQSGAYIKTLSGLDKPVSLAVDEDIRLYVGNKDRANVEVYDADLQLQFKLGTGDGEFTHPGAIAVDSSGKVYVVDSGADKIKIYNSDGSYDSEFGGYGSGNGQFNFPTSIAVDEGRGELIITDLQLISVSGEQVEGARVQVFDKAGVYKRSFGEYGVGEGKIAKTLGVAVDSESRVYVTDSLQHVVHVYDSISGEFLGTIFDVSDPMRNPMGVAIGMGNKLYVASLTTRTVEVYGIEPYAEMTVTPLSLSFEGQEGSSPAEQTVQIANNGTSTLNWTASTATSWITISGESGTTLAEETSALGVGVNLGGLTADTYTGSISISAESGAVETVSVELTVEQGPQLSVSPGALQFRSENGSNPAVQGLSIGNTGQGTLSWSAVKDGEWITVSKTSGTAPESINVTVDISGKEVGSYSGEITVTGAGALSSPAVIAVTMEIVQVSGRINVTSNIAEAAYTINGPESYSANGVSWTETEAPTGTYAIIYADVEGYESPAGQSGTLSESGTLNFSGEYVSTEPEVVVNRNIITGAGPESSNSAVVKVFKSDGTETGVEFEANGYGYGVNVAAGDVNGDGEQEIITAPGPGPANPAEISIFDKNGNKLTNLSITASGYKYGATVACGDLNGDGYDEVVVGAGAGAENPAEVKVFVYEAGGDVLVDSGIELTAYGTGYGVMVAVGDKDGDGEQEIITAPGPGQNNEGVVRVWRVDTTGGVGQWSAVKIQEYTVESDYGYSVNIGAGDINGDGYEEVITGAGPHRGTRDEIKVYDRNGAKVSEFKGYIVSSYGATVAGGDLDKDGVAEIVVGAGPGSRNRAIVKVFDVNGVEQCRFKALSTKYGVNVAVGDLGLQ